MDNEVLLNNPLAKLTSEVSIHIDPKTNNRTVATSVFMDEGKHLGNEPFIDEEDDADDSTDCKYCYKKIYGFDKYERHLRRKHATLFNEFLCYRCGVRFNGHQGPENAQNTDVCMACNTKFM